MYFWYSQGIEDTSKGVPMLELYQSAIMVWPSGFSDGHKTVITFSRIAVILGLSSATSS